MTAASASHRLLNFVQSALLLGLMAAIAWIAVTAIVGPETGLLMALAMVGGLLFAPALPRRLLLSAYQAQRLTDRDAPGLVAALAELARRAGLQRAGALSRAEPAAERLRPGQARGQRHLRHSPAARPARRRELAGVLAHEIGHIANRDLWIMILLPGRRIPEFRMHPPTESRIRRLQDLVTGRTSPIPALVGYPIERPSRSCQRLSQYFRREPQGEPGREDGAF